MAAIVLTEKEKKYGAIVAAVVVLCLAIPQYAEQYSTQYLRKEQSRKNTLNQEIQDLTARLAGIEDERRLLLVNREDYLRWVDRGVVGKQDQLPWVNAMKTIREERRLFPIANTLEEAQVYAPEDSPWTNDSTIQIKATPQNFQMEMLHDLDFLMLLSSLREEMTDSSLFFPTTCAVTRLQHDFVLESRGNLSVDCSLVWISADDPARKADVAAAEGDA